ncbi:MAG: FHIPEP family type III secretion protein, partial [Desulfurobacteriaceae bacterium]
GMPTVPFALLSALVAAVGYMIYLAEKEREVKEAEERARKLLKEAKKEKEPEELIVQPEPITLEIGYSLIPYVDESQSGEIVKKIKNLRKQLAKELGIIIPLVHLRDNLELKPNEYRILLRDVEVARGEVVPGAYLAIDTGGVKGKVKGKPTKEPAFGLTAYWVDESEKDRAKLLGYTVVDIATVIVTHLSEVIKRHAHEIVSRADVKQLVDNLSKKYPVVKEMVPEPVSYGVLTKVIQNLLKEGIPVKDLLTIIEAIADNIEKTNDPDLLT